MTKPDEAVAKRTPLQIATDKALGGGIAGTGAQLLQVRSYPLSLFLDFLLLIAHVAQSSDTTKPVLLHQGVEFTTHEM